MNVKHRTSTTTKENIFALHLSQKLKTLLNSINQANMRLRLYFARVLQGIKLVFVRMIQNHFLIV